MERMETPSRLKKKTSLIPPILKRKGDKTSNTKTQMNCYSKFFQKEYKEWKFLTPEQIGKGKPPYNEEEILDQEYTRTEWETQRETDRNLYPKTSKLCI